MGHGVGQGRGTNKAAKTQRKKKTRRQGKTMKMKTYNSNSLRWVQRGDNAYQAPRSLSLSPYTPFPPHTPRCKSRLITVADFVRCDGRWAKKIACLPYWKMLKTRLEKRKSIHTHTRTCNTVMAVPAFNIILVLYRVISTGII